MNNQTSWRERLRPLFLTLSFLSLGWVIYILRDAWPEAQKSLSSLNLHWAIVSLFGFVVGGYIVFECFFRLFTWRHPGACKRPLLGNLFFSSQLMKHIPGRIWGVAYQAATVRSIKVSEWIAINIVYSCLTSFFAIFVACVILLIPINEWLSIIAFISITVLYFSLWSSKSIDIFIKSLNKLSFKKLETLSSAIHEYKKCSTSSKLEIYMICILGWVLYYASWGVFGLAWPTLGFWDGALLCAIYTFSWFVGYISIATPSGLGVRELVFISLSLQFPSDAVAGMIIFGRLALLFADVILGVTFLPFSKRKS